MLINDQHGWKEDFIRSNFLEIVARQILNIPQPRAAKKDKVLWHYDKRGKFSVKNAYKVALKCKNLNAAGCSSESNEWWSLVWGLSIPAKIKMFFWRALTKAIVGLRHGPDSYGR